MSCSSKDLLALLFRQVLLHKLSTSKTVSAGVLMAKMNTVTQRALILELLQSAIVDLWISVYLFMKSNLQVWCHHRLLLYLLLQAIFHLRSHLSQKVHLRHRQMYQLFHQILLHCLQMLPLCRVAQQLSLQEAHLDPASRQPNQVWHRLNHPHHHPLRLQFLH